MKVEPTLANTINKQIVGLPLEQAHGQKYVSVKYVTEIPFLTASFG